MLFAVPIPSRLLKVFWLSATVSLTLISGLLSEEHSIGSFLKEVEKEGRFEEKTEHSKEGTAIHISAVSYKGAGDGGRPQVAGFFAFNATRLQPTFHNRFTGGLPFVFNIQLLPLRKRLLFLIYRSLVFYG